MQFVVNIARAIMGEEEEEEEKKKCDNNNNNNNNNSHSTQKEKQTIKNNNRLRNELKQLAPDPYYYKKVLASSAASAASAVSVSNHSNNNNDNDNQLLLNPNSIQLFANDFYFEQNDNNNNNNNNKDQMNNNINNHNMNKTNNNSTKPSSISTNTNTNNINTRPKRQIKQVVKYQPNNRNYKQEYKLRQMAGKVGTGFLCPGCNMHLSYDAKQCWSCQLGCCYVAGVGVVVCKDRESIVELDGLKEQEIILDDDDDDDDDNGDDGDDDHVVVRSTTTTKTRSRHSTSNKRKATSNDDNKFNTKMHKHNNNNNNTTSKPSLHQQYSTSIVSKNGSGNYSENKDEIIVECEACFGLFQASYLQRHRRSIHDLPPTTFGCPYCSKSFLTMKERIGHIQKNHSGKPHCVDEETKEMTKVYIYNCPKCVTSKTKNGSNDILCRPMSFHQLKDHLSREHKIDIYTVLDDITTSCPFCIGHTNLIRRNTNNMNIFKTMTSLWNHVKMNHDQCDIIGKRLNIGGRSSSYHENKVDNRKIENTHNDIEELEVEEIESIDHWEPLSYDSLRYLYNLDRGILKRGQTYDSLSNYVHYKLTKINDLEKCHIQSQQSSRESNSLHDDITAENKLYVRGLRERSGKAASEALEKMNYKVQCDELQRKMEYENRGKKKSPEELETNEFILRPFHFALGNGGGSKTRQGICNLGDTCGLCNGDYASCIVTDEEIEQAGGDILNALRVGDFCGGKNRHQIRHLNFWPVSDSDIPDDRDETDGKKTSSKSRRPRDRNPNNNIKVWIEYWRLIEMQHSLAFVKEYNQGLFQQVRKK